MHCWNYCTPNIVLSFLPIREVFFRTRTNATWLQLFLSSHTLRKTTLADQCAEKGHVRQTCPRWPPWPLVSNISYACKPMAPLTTTLIIDTPHNWVTVLLDLGSVGNFISTSLCHQLKIPLILHPTQFKICCVRGLPQEEDGCVTSHLLYTCEWVGSMKRKSCSWFWKDFPLSSFSNACGSPNINPLCPRKVERSWSRE